MQFKVEECWDGRDGFYFRVGPPSGGERFRVYGARWTRAVASAALDEAARIFRTERRNVRFIHR